MPEVRTSFHSKTRTLHPKHVVLPCLPDRPQPGFRLPTMKPYNSPQGSLFLKNLKAILQEFSFFKALQADLRPSTPFHLRGLGETGLTWGGGGGKGLDLA